MKFRLVRPILTPEWHKLLIRFAQQLGIEQCLERMVEYKSDLSRCGAQLFQNRYIIQECNHGRHQHPIRRDERFECAKRMNVRRAQRKRNFLVGFPKLYNYGARQMWEAGEEMLTAVSTTPASVLSISTSSVPRKLTAVRNTSIGCAGRGDFWITDKRSWLISR